MLTELEQLRQENADMLRVMELIKSEADKFAEIVGITYESHPTIEDQAVAFNERVYHLLKENERLITERKMLREAAIAAEKYISGTAVIFSHRTEAAVLSRLRVALGNLIPLENERPLDIGTTESPKP
jgi:ribosomal protein L16 Arg81 hydroxylase